MRKGENVQPLRWERESRLAMTILVLEDDRMFNETLCEFLEEEGYKTVGVYDARTATDCCYHRRFDLYLLDINLPMGNGLNFLRSLRESGDETPAIFLTSRDDRASLIEGLKIGADDYLRKPVDLEELALRIRANIRRHQGPERYRIDNYLVDAGNYRVFRGEEEIELGRKPFELLLLFLKYAGETVTTERIASSLWPTAQEASYGAIRVYVTQLKKLFGKRIENVRGVGYRFCQDEQVL
ncbi:response regulator transcription factor [Nitratifractor sp.]